MALEQYIPSIAFVMTAVIGVYISNLLFKGGKGWTKSPIFTKRFLTKEEGFIVFLISVVIGSLASVFAQPYLEAWLNQNSSNFAYIVLAFLGVTAFYYKQNFY